MRMQIRSANRFVTGEQIDELQIEQTNKRNYCIYNSSLTFEKKNLKTREKYILKVSKLLRVHYTGNWLGSRAFITVKFCF